MPGPNEAALSALDGEYSGVEPVEPGSYDEVPDGTYQVRVNTVEVKKSTAGNLMLSWDLRVVVGEHENRAIFHRNMLQTADNLKFLKTDLATCGIVLAKLSDLEDRAGELLDQVLEVKVKTKGEFKNVWINKRLDIPDSSVQGGPATHAAPASGSPAAHPPNAPAAPVPARPAASAPIKKLF